MANNPGLVRELFDAIQDCSAVCKECPDKGVEVTGKMVTIQRALIRAREALRWIPVTERLPEESGPKLVTASIKSHAGKRHRFMAQRFYHAGDRKFLRESPDEETEAWTELSAYTPEEK